MTWDGHVGLFAFGFVIGAAAMLAWLVVFTRRDRG